MAHSCVVHLAGCTGNVAHSRVVHLAGYGGSEAHSRVLNLAGCAGSVVHSHVLHLAGCSGSVAHSRVVHLAECGRSAAHSHVVHLTGCSGSVAHSRVVHLAGCGGSAAHSRGYTWWVAAAVWCTPLWYTWQEWRQCGTLPCGTPGRCGGSVAHSHVVHPAGVAHSRVVHLAGVAEVWYTPVWYTWWMGWQCGTLPCGTPGGLRRQCGECQQPAAGGSSAGLAEGPACSYSAGSRRRRKMGWRRRE